jgi:hypothetical protein
MPVRIEIREQEGGEYQAICPDMGISCLGPSLESVLERIRDLLVFYYSSVAEDGVPSEEHNERARQLRAYLKDKNLFLPQDPKIH